MPVAAMCVLMLGADCRVAMGADTVHIGYRITQDWGSGLERILDQGLMRRTVPAWRLEFDTPFTITSVWDARTPATGQPRARAYRVIGPSWDGGNLSPGETATLGFTGTPGASAPPGNATLNGQSVAFNADSAAAPGQPVPVPSPVLARAALIPYVDATAWPPLEFDRACPANGGPAGRTHPAEA